MCHVYFLLSGMGMQAWCLSFRKGRQFLFGRRAGCRSLISP
ncbi:hypothetical protein BACCAP_02694 [Pseudoflavonifractor capillosus ATCC 29799]|uniref:Uncharacterized protein n=1 Tax=Pseudoflavonifractor capillosus ATCC 29799 TaxID=411467 RepID=A6NWU8_9FIRM|nr:hypothetical protein BACCAP_02694 [Pseudoflavonifractor capillosus ATCC 29799]